jgi:hypothetical protein
MVVLFFLSCKLAPISNVICEGQRSLNRTSTPSRVDIRSSSTHPTTTTTLPSHPIRLNHTRRPGKWPLPSLEGCGPDLQHPQQARTHRVDHPPLPFPGGCGRFKLFRCRNRAGRNTMGDQRYGRAIRCVTKTNHDKRRGSFSPIPPSSICH